MASERLAAADKVACGTTESVPEFVAVHFITSFRKTKFHMKAPFLMASDFPKFRNLIIHSDIDRSVRKYLKAFTRKVDAVFKQAIVAHF